jgi:RHS repeat-associated protein
LVERDADTTGSGVLNQRLYVQQDANQNVTALVDTSGNVVERYTYDPYGQVTVMDGAWNVLAGSAFDSRYLFQGGRYEAAIGDYQFGAREYRPSIQVWTSVDPIGFAGGSSNLYRFVSNNPVNQMDPNGTDIYHASTWENLIFPHQDIRVDTWESRGGKWHRTGTVYYSYGLSQTKTIWAFGRGGQILPLGYDARTLVQVPFTNISITVLVGIVSTGPSKGSYNVVQRLSTTPEQDIAFKAILDRTVGNYGPYSFLGPNSFDGLTCRKHAQLWFGEAKRLFPHVQQYTAPPDFWDNASTNFQRFWEADKPAALANAFNAATEAATPLRSRLNPKLVERFEQLRAQGMSVDQIIIQLKSEGILPK